jgi:hypothetical protein
MNANECNLRASQCAANAAVAADETVSLEFLKMAAQWRAIAVRQIFIGYVADPITRRISPNILAVSTVPAG